MTRMLGFAHQQWEVITGDCAHRCPRKKACCRRRARHSENSKWRKEVWDEEGSLEPKDDYFQWLD